MLTEVKRTMHEQNKTVNKEKEILPNNNHGAEEHNN